MEVQSYGEVHFSWKWEGWVGLNEQRVRKECSRQNKQDWKEAYMTEVESGQESQREAGKQMTAVVARAVGCRQQVSGVSHQN